MEQLTKTDSQAQMGGFSSHAQELAETQAYHLLKSPSSGWHQIFEWSSKEPHWQPRAWRNFKTQQEAWKTLQSRFHIRGWGTEGE